MKQIVNWFWVSKYVNALLNMYHYTSYLWYKTANYGKRKLAVIIPKLSSTLDLLRDLKLPFLFIDR